MKKLLTSTLLLFITVTLLAQKYAITPNKPAGKARTIGNSTTYINGYSDYTVVAHPVNNDSGKTFIHELRFNNTFSSFYTRKVMFDKKGIWSEESRAEGKIIPILIWNKINLLHNGELYTVYADGIESEKEIYSSVVVYNDKGEDCLAPSHSAREALITYFSQAIQKKEKSKRFYTVFWKKIDEYQSRKL